MILGMNPNAIGLIGLVILVVFLLWITRNDQPG